MSEPTDAPSALVRALCRATFRPLFARLEPRGLQLAVIRTAIDVAGRLALLGPTRTRAVRVTVPVAGEWVLPRGSAPGVPLPGPLARRPRGGPGVVLYLHGGGYVAGSPRASRSVTSALAHATGLPVFAPAYRRAPEHQFPAALDDCLAAARHLVEAGVPMHRIAVAGDSAGAHLAVGLVAALAGEGGEIPAALALFSPLLEPDGREAATLDRRRPDPMIPPEFALRCAEAYVPGLGASELGAPDPRLRILTADDDLLAGFPPLLVQCGTSECYRDDARRLHDRLTALGRDSTYALVPGQVHSFVTLNRLLRPSGSALRHAADFLRLALDRAGASDGSGRIPEPSLLLPTAGPAPARRGDDLRTWYPLAEADDDFLRSAPVRVTRSLDLDVSPEELWAVLTADDAVRSWGRLVTSSRWAGNPARGVGAVREVTLAGMITVREHFFRWEEPHRKTFAATHASLPGLRRFAEDYVVEPACTGSRLTWTVALEPAVPVGPLNALARPALELAIESLLDGLRRRASPGRPARIRTAPGRRRIVPQHPAPFPRGGRSG